MQDASKVVLGSTNSSDKEVSSFVSDPADTPAGRAVSLADDSSLSLALADGNRIGISLGKDLQNTLNTVVARSGLRVPIELNEPKASLTVNGDLVFEAVEGGADGNDITITLADTVTAGSEEASVVGTDITIAIEATQSTATQVKAAFDALPAAVALATCTIVEGEESAAQAALAEDALEGGIDAADYVVIGAKAYIDDITGKANEENQSDVTISDATYVSGVLTGIKEDGTEVPAALVDIPGGL